VERLERVGQRADHSVVDGVAHLRPIDRHGGDAARVLADENGGFAHRFLPSDRLSVDSDCIISRLAKTAV
jgi:hypothetical protein